MNQELLHSLFDYKDGKLHWKESPSRNVKAGDVAGHYGNRRYAQIGVNGKYYSVHRLIFLWHYGFLPNTVDHKDGNPSNNNIENLREATQRQNQHNSTIRKDNISGLKGVVWSKRLQKWYVQLKVNGVQRYFGSYKNIDYAKFVSEAMRYKYHKEFARS